MDAARFIEKQNKEPTKLNRWNHQEVRVALDDLIVKYMNDVNGFKEDHSHTNWKIFWLFLFNGVALAALGYEKLRGFGESKAILLTASAFFLICHNIYHYYHLWLAPSAFYRGTAKDGKTIWLGSKLVLPEGKYELTVSHRLADGRLKEVNRWGTCVGKWITEDGFVETAAVAADLKTIRLSES